MSFKPSIFALFVVGAAAFSAGCTAEPHWISAPNVPNPVLLGPVDRVGGHRASESGQAVGTLDETVDDSVQGKTDNNGNLKIDSRASEETAKVSEAVRSATGSNPKLDVRIENLRAGGYVFFAGGSMVAEKWVGIRGSAIAEGGAR